MGRRRTLLLDCTWGPGPRQSCSKRLISSLIAASISPLVLMGILPHRCQYGEALPHWCRKLCVHRKQKADVVQHRKAFDHAGLLSTNPPAGPGCFSSSHPTTGDCKARIWAGGRSGIFRRGSRAIQPAAPSTALAGLTVPATPLAVGPSIRLPRQRSRRRCAMQPNRQTFVGPTVVGPRQPADLPPWSSRPPCLLNPAESIQPSRRRD